jgi:hypothetical protein
MTLKGKNINSYLGKNRIKIDKEGVIRSNHYRNEHIKWEGIIKIVTTKEHIFIHDTDVSALIIPKRAFRSKELMNEFITQLKQYQKAGERIP